MFVFPKTLPCSWKLIIDNSCFLILKSFVKQLVSIMFINNNCASFCSLLKEKLVKHQKASKYYDQNFECLQNVFLLFISVISLNCQKQSHFGWNLFYFSKKHPRPNLKEITLAAQWIDRKSNYQVRQILGSLCKVVSLILG